MAITDDYADTQAGATALAFSTPLSGQLGTPQDKDVFKVPVTKGRTYVFAFAAENAQGDPVLKGWADGHADAPVYYSPVSTLTYVADYSGDYYLEAGNRTTPGTASYKLVVAEQYPDDYPATQAGAGTLPVGGKISGQVEINGDRDWFNVYLQRGVKYAFTLEGKGLGEGTMPVGRFGAKVFLEATPQSTVVSRLLDSDANHTHYSLAAETSGYHTLSVYDDGQFFVTPDPTFHTGTYTLHAALVPNGAGSSGNDTLAGPGTGTVIAGGAGLDTTVYAGARATYAVTQAAAAINVTRANASNGDSLTGVERLLFDDVAVALDTSGAGGQAFRLYQAAFNRAPDKGGIGFWMAHLDKGTSLHDVAQSFIDSAEFKILYGGTLSDAVFVDELYQNVLHRTGESDGVTYWNDVLAKGASRADVLAAFSESPENQAAMLKVIGNGFEYTPYG